MTKTSKTGTVLLYTAFGFFIFGVILLFVAFSSYSWLSFVPLLLAILQGLIALILAAIGVILKMVGRTPAAELTPEQRAQSIKATQRNTVIFGSVFAVLAVVLYMSFVAPIDVVNAKYHSLDKIKASAPQGFDFGSEFDDPSPIRFCNNLNAAALCDTNAWSEGYTATPHPPAEYCKLIFDWVSDNEATTWNNDYKGFEFKKDDPIAMMACVTANMKSIVGKNGKYQWELTLDIFSNPGLFNLTTYIQDRGANSSYDAFVSEVSATDPSQKAAFSTLNHIGAWRKLHSQSSNSEHNIREAIKGVGLKKVQVFTQKNNATYLAYQSPGDPNQTMCLSVAKFDEKFFGIKDPGHGYFPFSAQTIDTIGQFGFVSSTTCGQD